jgi:serine/threonine protein kinase
VDRQPSSDHLFFERVVAKESSSEMGGAPSYHAGARRSAEEKKASSSAASDHTPDPNPEMRFYPRTQHSAAEEDEIHDRYFCESYLGHGSMAMVFLGKKRSDQTEVAIKKIQISETPKSINQLITELNVFKRIGSHASIVKLHCAYRHESYCYFVMDHLEGGDLRKLLREIVISQEAIAYIIACIGSALNHLHRHHIIHRDVKPDNIGFDRLGRPYLLDFGIAYVSPQQSPEGPLVCSESSGTLIYLAPEVLTASHRHSYQSDYWSLGVVAHELLYHCHPFVPHVPKTFVSYVSDHYHFVTATDDQNSAPQSISREENLLTLRPDRVIPLHLMHSFPNTRDLPLALAQRTDSGDFVHTEMIELLNGLLDLRIPFRLRFSQFTHQPLFARFSYQNFQSLPDFVSPLIFELSMANLLSINPQLSVPHRAPIPQQVTTEPFSAGLEDILEQNFPYSPSDDHRIASGNQQAQMNQPIHFDLPLLTSLSTAEEMKITTVVAIPPAPPQSE